MDNPCLGSGYNVSWPVVRRLHHFVPCHVCGRTVSVNKVGAVRQHRGAERPVGVWRYQDERWVDGQTGQPAQSGMMSESRRNWSELLIEAILQVTWYHHDGTGEDYPEDCGSCRHALMLVKEAQHASVEVRQEENRDRS